MKILGDNHNRRVISYYLVTIIIGSFLLLWDISSTGSSISFIDALFTATSAVCVTGLTVLDTGKDFSLFGQLVILLLIQLGGIGVMTLTTAAILSFGRKISFQNRFGFSQGMSPSLSIKPGSLVLTIVITTFVIETIGAILLFAQFTREMPPLQAAYTAMFHSVSAFCNAGFSLFSNSLEGYTTNSYMLMVFAGLIICGGLGFIVIYELYHKAKNNRQQLSLHTKLCLSATVILLIGGTILFYVLETKNVMSGYSFADKLTNSFFQSVTTRTAGFNSFAQANLTELSLLITILLMFIGACPGSTGGGIKTTTFAVLGLIVVNRFWGRRSAVAFNSAVSFDSVKRAAIVIILSFVAIIVAFSIFLSSEALPLSHQLTPGTFLENLFEVISAFATVGLSMGVTPHLHALGKVLLIILMFMGRVGLITLAFALARAPRHKEITYLEEEIMIG